MQERYAEVLHLGSALGVEERVRLHLVREPFFLLQAQLVATAEEKNEQKRPAPPRTTLVPDACLTFTAHYSGGRGLDVPDPLEKDEPV